MKTKFWLYFLTLTNVVINTQSTQAQTYQPTNRAPVSDNTLGTQISGTGNNFDIKGGINKGQTLFHSFTDFSVPTNGQANFLNPVGNRDIITRVTGNLFSDINGIVNTNGANFFLINPNGIVFGTNAKLNVGKAFVGSTANSIDLVDGAGKTITFGTNPNGDAPLLSVAPNVLFDVSRLNLGGGTGAISNFGTLQTTNPNQYIGLIGGNVTLDGSQGGGKIIAHGGRVDIGGFNGAGTVSVDNNGLGSSSGVGRSNVLLTNSGGITVRATGNLDTVSTFFSNVTAPGSSINISANNLDLLNAGAKSGTQPAAIDAGLELNSGGQTKATGDINIDATGKVNVNNSVIKNTLRSGAEGSIGDIKIQAGTLDVNNNSLISTVISGKGNAGNVKVKAKDAVSLANSGIYSTVESGAVGKGGNIEIDADSLSITNGTLSSSTIGTFGASATQPAGEGDAGNITVNVTGAVNIDVVGRNGIFTTGIFSNLGTGAKGNAGNIDIKAGSLLTNGANIQAETAGIGNAGNITVTAKNVVSLADTNVYSLTGIKSVGEAGNININADSLSLTNTSLIDAATNGIGNAGNIKITAKNAVSLADYRTTIFSGVEAKGVGKGGNIDVDAASLSLTDGALIQSSTSGQGNAGKITVTAKDAVSLSYSYLLGTVETGGVGKGGNIDVNARSLSLTNGAQLKTSIRNSSLPLPGGQGNGGDITVNVTGNVDISGLNINGDNTPLSGIRTEVQSGGQGNAGNIIVNAGSFSLTNDGYIQSSTYGTGNAGNVTVTAKDTVHFDNSGIASLVGTGGLGNGGSININSGSVSLTNGTYLQSSTYGTGNAGNVTVNAKNAVSADKSSILSTLEVGGVGKGGTIDINASSLSMTNGAQLETITREASATKPAGQGDAGNVNVKVSGAVDISGINGTFPSGIRSTVGTGTVGNGGNITLNAGSFSLRDGAQLVSSTYGTGSAGNILLNSGKVILNNGDIFSESNSFTGGNITIKNTDYLLLRNDSSISTNSDSTNQNGDGGNITINSPLIVATPGNNDITANAYQGTGGRVNITSRGLFGIQYRAQGSPLTSDITASSTLGQNGSVNITTPGTDPGKDSTQLPNTATDASNQISQVCGDGTRQNKLTVTGRGGLPSNANDPLTSDVIWQDARAVSSQPAVSTHPAKLAPPAVGLVFDGKGKVTLVAASTEGQIIRTNVVCPSK